MDKTSKQHLGINFQLNRETMNRFKKEEKRKRYEARKGLTPEQVVLVTKEEEKNRSIEELARNIHAEEFSEECDFMYDSISDANDRSNGVNPMNSEYISKTNKKRKDLGVSPLSESGLSMSNDTMLICLEEARKKIKKTTT